MIISHRYDMVNHVDWNRFLVIVELAVVHSNEGLPVLEDLSPSIVLWRQHLYRLGDLSRRGSRSGQRVLSTAYM